MTKNRNGKKLYPVCNWQNNQHKMFNYYDKMYLKMIDNDYDDNSIDDYENAERLLNVFNTGVYNDGLVYAEYNDYKAIKDIISFYDCKSDFTPRYENY